jgi:hypothetical protein
LGAKRKNTPLGEHQIGQSEQGVPLRRVLGEPLVSHLREGEQIFHHVKGMFHLGPNPGLERLVLAQQAAERAVFGNRRARQLIEPPTADPHGGWCGGRRRETSKEA